MVDCDRASETGGIAAWAVQAVAVLLQLYVLADEIRAEREVPVVNGGVGGNCSRGTNGTIDTLIAVGTSMFTGSDGIGCQGVPIKALNSSGAARSEGESRFIDLALTTPMLVPTSDSSDFRSWPK